MSPYWDRVFKAVRKEERRLRKNFQELNERVRANEFVLNDNYTYGASAEETSALYDEARQTEPNGAWEYTHWVNSNRIPQGKHSLMRDGRFPQQAVAFWYTPFNYYTNGDPTGWWRTPNGQLDQEALDAYYAKAETKKVLFSEFGVQVCLFRRSAIPSSGIRWGMAMTPPEYVLFIDGREILSGEKLSTLEKRCRRFLCTDGKNFIH